MRTRSRASGKIEKRNLLASAKKRPRHECQKEEIKLANRTYEVMYIVDPDTAADKVTKLERFVGIVDRVRSMGFQQVSLEVVRA